MASIEKKSYRQIFKATSIFGGVQVFNILISLIRSKIIAVLLGTIGYGFMGLLNSPLGFISKLTGLGIGFSAIRDIASANEMGDQVKLSITLKTFRRWVWFTGLMGMFVVIILSPWLSQWSFSNKEYTWAYILISVTLLLNALSSGQSAILRGTRRIKDTAKAGAYGSALGLIISIPLYYFYGLKGIVPAIIVSAIIALFLSWHFSKKVKTIPVQITFRESYHQGKEMVKLGVMITLTGLIGSGVNYLVIAFIGNTGGMSEVGIYNAGWAITNQYVGLVFAAMGADYYPRLAGIQHDNVKIKEIVNQQAEITVLIIAPLMLFYLCSLPVLVPLLYSKQFLAIIPFTQWVVLGMLFKAVSWTLGFIILAKGNSRLFLGTETTSNIFLLTGNIFGYHYLGMEGVGITFVGLYILLFLLILFICNKKYDFNFSKEFIKLFVFQFLLCCIAFIIVYIFGHSIGYITGGILLIISTLYSYKKLNEKIGIKEFIFSKIKRK